MKLLKISKRRAAVLILTAACTLSPLASSTMQPKVFAAEKEKQAIQDSKKKIGDNKEKIDALKKDNRVSFCVYDKGYLKEGKVGLNINNIFVDL